MFAAILNQIERKYGWEGLSLSPEARAAIAARGRAILTEHLDVVEPPDPILPAPGGPSETLPLRALLAEVERQAIRRALSACGGSRTRTAERLGISRRQLFDKIREYDLHP